MSAFLLITALRQLASAKPTEPRDNVSKALLAALGDSDRWTRRYVAEALGIWGTAEAVPALVKLLDGDTFVRQEAMEALGKLKHPDAAAPLARFLGRFEDATKAAQALEAIGPPAEEALIAVLKENNPDAREEACRVLENIGTEKSLPELARASTNSHGFLDMRAEAAIRAIKARVQGKSTRARE